MKSLFKRLDYIETEHDYKKEILSEADLGFIQNINKYLDQNPDIKKIYEDKINRDIDKNIEKIKKKAEEAEKKEAEESTPENDENNEKDSNSFSEEEIDNIVKKAENSPKTKKLYREIVKKTHPDKIKNEKLNELYIEATDYYNKNNKLGIYKVCDDLGITYDLDEEDLISIEERIKKLESKISFMESTYTWKWFSLKTEEEKTKLIVEFIKLKLN